MIIALPVSPGDKETTYFINQAYVKYLSDAGFEPLLVTPFNDPLKTAEKADGLLLPGGKDIDPLFYGDDNRSSYFADPERDDFERKLLWAFANAGKRVFGICRGMQLIALEYMNRTKDKTAIEAMGYFQDIAYHAQTGTLNLARKHASHIVYSHTGLLYGPGKKEEEIAGIMKVNSMHHQAVWIGIGDKQLDENPRVGKHLTVLAWTERGLALKKGEVGNILEAFFLRGWTPAPMLAVQWHPEEMGDVALISNFFRGESVKDIPKAKVVKG